MDFLANIESKMKRHEPLRIQPDFGDVYNIPWAEKLFPGFKFQGEGYYITKSGNLLVKLYSRGHPGVSDDYYYFYVWTNSAGHMPRNVKKEFHDIYYLPVRECI